LEPKSPLEVVIWNGRPGTSPADNKQTPEDAQPEFLTELEELEWLVTIADPLKNVTSTLERENIIEPPGSAVWPGPNTSERPDIIYQRTAQKFWKIRRDAILQQQREMNAVLAEERAVRAHEKKQKVDAENKKRKAASSDGPIAKRARREAAAEDRAKAQAECEKNRAARQEELDRQKEEFEISKWREAKLEANAAIAAKIREALQAQAKNLSSLPEKEREREEREIEAQTRSEHEEQQRQEKMIKEMRIKDLNMERAQKGLQPLPEVTTLSDAEVRRLADERQRRAQKKRSQEAGTQRKEAEEKQEKTAPAIKQVAEPAKDDLAALAKNVADAKAADAEKRRLQFIADKRLANEQRQKAVAAAEARAEAMKREQLFKDKYGVLPGERLRLDNSGNAEPSQGFYPRTQGPPDLSTNVLAASRYWIQREAREGLEIRAKLEKRSTDDIVREKGHANTEQYLQTLSNSITEDDIPPIVRNQGVRELKWEALNRRITSVGEWEYRIRALPGAGRAESRIDGANESYAEL
jgi:hypothetical protein